MAIIGILYIYFFSLKISPYCIAQNVTHYKLLRHQIQVIIFPLNSVINLYIHGTKLTLDRLPEASWNRLGQVIFWLNLPDGLANKIQSIKQHQTRLFKDVI